MGLKEQKLDSRFDYIDDLDIVVHKNEAVYLGMIKRLLIGKKDQIVEPHIEYKSDFKGEHEFFSAMEKIKKLEEKLEEEKLKLLEEKYEKKKLLKKLMKKL